MNAEEVVEPQRNPAERAASITTSTSAQLERTPWWVILILVFRFTSYILLTILISFVFVSYKRYTKDALFSFAPLVVVLFVLMKMRDARKVSRAKVLEHIALGSLPCILLYVLISVVLLAAVLQTCLFAYYGADEIRLMYNVGKESQENNEQLRKIMENKIPMAIDKFLDSDAFKHPLIRNRTDLNNLAIGYTNWMKNISLTEAEKLFHRVYSRFLEDSLQMARPFLPERFRSKQFSTEYPEQVYKKAPFHLKNISMEVWAELKQHQKNFTAKLDKNLTKQIRSPPTFFEDAPTSFMSFWLVDLMKFPFWFVVSLFQLFFLHVVSAKNRNLIHHLLVTDICILSSCAALAFLPLSFHFEQGLVPFLLQALQNGTCGWWIGCVVARSRNVREKQISPIGMVLLIAAALAYVNSISHAKFRAAVLVIVRGVLDNIIRLWCRMKEFIRNDSTRIERTSTSAISSY